MTWRIVLRARDREPEAALPPALVTLAPGFRHESMPDEVGLLLPSNQGPKGLLDTVAVEPSLCAGAILGLFLAGPFLNIELESERLAKAGVGWIANAPSLAQYDESFSQQLADVGLDLKRELDCLKQFKDRGFRIAVVVTDGPGAATAAEIEPEALIVMPRVADFAAGFPSRRHRGAAALAVSEAAEAAGWSGLRLGLGEEGEAEHPRLWPEPMDGLVCRPRRL